MATLEDETVIFVVALDRGVIEGATRPLASMSRSGSGREVRAGLDRRGTRSARDSILLRDKRNVSEKA